jgi:hypothetical protein
MMVSFSFDPFSRAPTKINVYKKCADLIKITLAVLHGLVLSKTKVTKRSTNHMFHCPCMILIRRQPLGGLRHLEKDKKRKEKEPELPSPDSFALTEFILSAFSDSSAQARSLVFQEFLNKQKS